LEKVKTKEIISNPEVDSCITEKAVQDLDTEKQVIIHCEFVNGFESQIIRVWQTIYLRDINSKHESKLLNAFNTPLHPTWLQLEPLTIFNFTLVFSGLPKSCKMFDLVEKIPQAGGFFVGKIKRTKSDVYTIRID
jgi:hypothetical protein